MGKFMENLHQQRLSCELEWRERRSEKARSKSGKSDKSRPKSHASTSASSFELDNADWPPSAPPALKHMITEGFGGQNLWIKAPVLSGALEKRGFRWLRKWKARWVELRGAELSYFADVPKLSNRREPRHLRKKVRITKDATLEDVDATTFILTPGPNEDPWELRTDDAPTKVKWMRALTNCIDIRIWLQHYESGAVLGAGGNGVVKKMTDKRTGKTFAVKSVDVAKFRNREAVAEEVEILRQITNEIGHENLVFIHKVYEENDQVYILLDLCEGGELYDRVVERGKFCERDAANIMRQLFSALSALHNHSILHLDIKPENILMADKSKDSKIMLTDFGLARMVDKKNPLDETSCLAGTVGYIAPEVVMSRAYSPAADVFSSGVILFILLVGYPPFYGDSEVDILTKITRGQYRFHSRHWSKVSEEAKDLVRKMLEVNPKKRISIEEALEHPWMKQFDTRQRCGSECEGSSEICERLLRFNTQRKTDSVGCLVSCALSEPTVEEFDNMTSVDTFATILRQVSPVGEDFVPIKCAKQFAHSLHVSPYVDPDEWAGFLDVDKDGYVSANDMHVRIRAMVSGDMAFTPLIYHALQKLGPEDSEKLTRKHFEMAFETLECPKECSEAFFKHWDEQLERRSTPTDTASDTSRESEEWSAERTVSVEQLADLIRVFPFVKKLFFHQMRTRAFELIRRASPEKLPSINETGRVGSDGSSCTSTAS